LPTQVHISDDHGRLAVALGDAAEVSEFIGESAGTRRRPARAHLQLEQHRDQAARQRPAGKVRHPAQRMLAEYLFAHTQVNRIVAETEVGNLAERRSLESRFHSPKAYCADPASGLAGGGTRASTRFCART
jgi:hypothetical protein